MQEARRASIQAQIDREKGLAQRRKLGQFATPFPLAREMASYGLSLLRGEPIAFLEPAIGTGAIFSALAQEAEREGRALARATGVELDPAYLRGARAVWGEEQLALLPGDFTRLSPDARYNFVLTNPPYVRHHYIPAETKAALRAQVREETGVDLSSLSGLYCYFLLLAHKWLAPGAVCGWLLPSEFMDVNYGNAIKAYLLRRVRLLRIHRYDPENSKFDDALVSSCVVWFVNETPPPDYDVEFSFDGTHRSPRLSRRVLASVLLAEPKWTRFPQKASREAERSLPSIGDFFAIKRGLATGDNRFFVLTRVQLEALGLPRALFRPVLPSPRFLRVDRIERDASGDPLLDPQLYLLDCDLDEAEIEARYPALWRYLQTGVPGTSGKYLCRNRKRWYAQEQRDATRFLCSYMGRDGSGRASLRFILNLSEAVATNSYLGLYPKGALQRVLDAHPEAVVEVWEALRAIGAADIDDEGRVYGGGLRKIEPRELARVPCEALSRLCERYGE